MSESIQNENGLDRTKGKWYVVNTMSGQENKIKETIENQLAKEDSDLGIYEVLIPTEKVSEVKRGIKTTTTRKFFPGYILIRMDLYDKDNKINNDSWYLIKQTKGIIGFVGGGNKPLPLSEREVKDLIGQLESKDEKIKPKVQFDLGETLRIRDGAFENFEGVVEEIDPDRGKLKLMVSIFGRSTPVELEFWQVEREK